MAIPKDFLSEEVRCGYTISAAMKQVWACQLELFEEFSRVCDKYKLRFWVDSGTLLGAVRHKGYIPWDDDLDVAMFREDYDKLVSIAQCEFQKPYVFQTAYSEPQFVRGHAQLRDSRTTAIIPYELYKDFNQGIFIDVFVMDYVPEDEKEKRRQGHRASMLRDKLELRSNPLIYSAGSLYNLYRAIKYRLKYPTRKSVVDLYRRYEDTFRCNKGSDCPFVAFTAWVYTDIRRDKHVFDETVYLDFEYLKVPVPKGYDKLLTVKYGDYMKPSHIPNDHGEVIFDARTPADIKVRELRRKTGRVKFFFNTILSFSES